MVRVIPEQVITYHRSARYICDVLLHSHRSYAAAEKCERNPNAREGGRGYGYTRQEIQARKEARGDD